MSKKNTDRIFTLEIQLSAAQLGIERLAAMVEKLNAHCFADRPEDSKPQPEKEIIYVTETASTPPERNYLGEEVRAYAGIATIIYGWPEGARRGFSYNKLIQDIADMKQHYERLKNGEKQ